MSKSGLICGPCIDIACHTYWDLASDRVMEWLLHLVNSGQVWYIHSSIPCTTFSIARQPTSRSGLHPWGDPKDSTLKSGNLLLQIALALAYAVVARGWGLFSHEHPDSAYSWQVPAWHKLLDNDDAFVVRFAMCAYDRP